jgi:hypothetical protein
MKYATERKIIHHGGAYGSLNAQQSIISNRTRTCDALFGGSDDNQSFQTELGRAMHYSEVLTTVHLTV